MGPHRNAQTGWWSVPDDLDAYLAEQLEDPGFAREYIAGAASGSFRDMVAWNACGWALRHVAGREFRNWIEEVLRRGMAAKVRDRADGRRPSR